MHTTGTDNVRNKDKRVSAGVPILKRCREKKFASVQYNYIIPGDILQKSIISAEGRMCVYKILMLKPRLSSPTSRVMDEESPAS
jgi:hypothetical protein